MKKTLSAVLAMIMMLSCFTFTGVSVFASAEFPMVYKNVTGTADLFTGSVDYVRAVTTTGTYHGLTSTKFEPIRVETINNGNNGSRAEADVSTMGQTVEGYGRIPNNNSIAANTNKLDYRIYRYAAVKYYYEVTHGGTPSANNMAWRTMASGKPEGTTAPAQVNSTALVTNKWAYAYFDLGSVASDTAYFCLQYHLDYMAKDGKFLTGRQVPEGETMYLEGCYYATSMNELPAIVDEYYSANAYAATATGASVKKVDMVDGTAYVVAPGEEEATVAVKLPIEINDTAKTPNLEIDYYLYTPDALADGITPVIYINGNYINGKAELVAGEWAVARFDISAQQAATEVIFYPYGTGAVDAEGDKLYIQMVSLLEYATTVLPDYTDPNLDSLGDIIPEVEDLVITGDTLGVSTVSGFETSVIDFVSGEALYVAPVAGSDVYSINVPVIIENTEWTPYLNFVVYSHNPTSDVSSVRPVIEFEDTEGEIQTVEAKTTLTGNSWNRISFDFSAFKQTTIYEVVLYPYGKSFTPAETDKIYINDYTISAEENTAAVGFAKPNLNEDGTFAPYTYDPGTGEIVVYYSTSGTYTGAATDVKNSTQAYATVEQAIAALDKVGGGILVLMSDWTVQGNDGLPAYTNMIKFRGSDEEGAEYATITFTGQARALGPAWFEENIHFTANSTGDRGYMARGHKTIFGKPGGDHDDITFERKLNNADMALNVTGGADGGEYPGVDLTFYSGQLPTQLRILGGWNNTTINGDVNVDIYNVDATTITNFKLSHNTGTVNGDININFHDGVKLRNAEAIACGAVTVNGDFNLNLNDDLLAGSIGALSSNIVFTGTNRLDMLNAPNTTVDTTGYNIIMKATSEQQGNETALGAGVAAVIAGSNDSVAYGGIVKAVGEGLSIGADYTEAAHVAPVIYTGTKLVIADGATFTLGGEVIFKDIEIVLGEGATIDAGDYAATFENTAVINGTGALVGSKIEIDACEDDLVITAADINAAAPSDTTLIELEGTEVVLFNETKTITVRSDIDDTIKNGSVVYYITNIEGATSVEGAMTIVDNGGVSVTLDNLVVNEWGTATFDATEMQGASMIQFTPATLPDGYYLYIHSINFSTNPLGYSLDYGAIETDRNGAIIYPVSDVEIPGINWLNRSDADGIKTEEKVFALGATTMLTYNKTTVTAPFVEYKLDAEADTEWQPYVKIEYYMHANGDETYDAAAKPVIEIDGVFVDAEQVITTNTSAIATFELTGVDKTYTNFRFYPYGTNATGFDSQNKVYMGDALISQTKDTTVPEYKVPALDEDGLVIPYTYTPDDGKPVVYVSPSTGSYTGEYTGSINSTVAYASINEAITALAGVDGYIILCDDVTAQHGDANKALSFATHKNMITIRGKVDEDNPTKKMELNVKYMTYLNGPMTFENLIINNIGTGDKLLSSDSNLLVLGKEGVENDVVLNGFVTMTGTNIVVNSANVPGIRFANWNGGAASYSGANIVINGGSVGAIKGAHVGGGTATINGDVNITINGGTITGAINPLTAGNNATVMNGNFTVTVTGGTFTNKDASIYTETAGSHVYTGGTYKRTLDILEYTGDAEALLAKFKLSAFDILKINTVYVSSETGDDANTGLTKSAPVATITQALKNMAVTPEGAVEGQVYSGRIKIIDYVIDGTEVVDTTVAGTEALIMGDTASSVVTVQEGYLKLAGDTRFKSITFNVTSENAGIDANSYKLVMEDDVKVTSELGLTVVGGTSGADITINGGKYDAVYGSIDDAAGDSNIVINGGEFGDIATAIGNLDGNANITINDGYFNGTIVGGSVEGGIDGEIKLTINGGTFGSDATIIGGNANDEGGVNGDVVVTITDGDFSAMDDKSIQAGSSSNINTEIKLVLSEYDGNITAKYDSIGFDGIIKARPAAPTVGGRFVYILEEIVTGKNGLKKAVPFKITQTASQTGTSVAVAPKQLNIKVDGADQAVMTVQVLGDGVTESIRYVPNHKATKGNSIVSDGWNIKGRGVDLSKHKYVEIVYYYTVPEGQEQIGKNMVFRPLGSYSAAGSINSTDLVANKWTTAIVDLSTIIPEKGLSGELGQYHFQPFGAFKGEQIPQDQYIDVISLTFYTDKPNTIITGGDAPSAVIRKDESASKPAAAAKPAKIEYNPLVVVASKLKNTVDKSGAFTGTEVQKDGKAVVKIVPNRDSDKVMSIEGYATIPTTEASPANTIDQRKYRYVVLKYFYETSNDTVMDVPEINICRGGFKAEEEPNLTKGGIYKSITSKEETKVNQWTYALMDINPADQNLYKTKQYHLRPFGTHKGNEAPEGDVVYIESLTFYAEMPTLDEQGNAIAKAPSASEEVVVEEDAFTDADIEAKDPTVVAPAALRYGMGTSNAFTSKVTTFEDKQVVAITPNTSSSDDVAIDGTTAVTAEDGVISMKNYKYAVIKYYFKTAKATATKNPSIEMLSIGLRDKDGAIGQKTFTATEALKANEWATATIRLSGTPSAYLSKGFILNPFGEMSGNSFAAGDTLYIESVTFCTEVE